MSKRDVVCLGACMCHLSWLDCADSITNDDDRLTD